MAAMNALQELLEYGQSYWLDNLTRGMIQSGELERLVREEGLRGVTSNPAIFNKAISQGRDYDEQMSELIAAGRSVGDIYEELVVRDIQDACDALRPVWEESSGVDGYVSLEVSPYLAHDTDGTTAEALRLYAWVARPNVLIKIPGTAAGVPAIEECIYHGVNVNITLLFSIESYEAIALAYMRGLERRQGEGMPIDDVASVASFFLSRIDSLTDRLLGQRISVGPATDPRPERLLGKAAVANAKLAYRRFLDLTAGERWQALASRGAHPQRMLWASTSTKNPLYDDVRYVEPLIGPDTVNTLPNSTIEAFADHGEVSNTVTDGLEAAEQVLEELAAVGIDFATVTWQLENEGVQAFIEPFDKLMVTIVERMREARASELSTVHAALGGDEASVAKHLTALQEMQFGRRVYARDASVWGAWDPDEAESIRERLGWLDSVESFCERIPQILEFAELVRDEGTRSVVLLGMGGSSLAAEVARRTFGRQEGWPDLFVLDSTDPASVRAIERQIDLASTLFLVASKSGTTLETMSFYRFFRARAEEAAAVQDAGSHFVAITDPGTPLAEEAAESGFRACYENPPDIGGRYSVLSYFGLLPMGLAGLPVGEILESARAMRELCGPFVPAGHNPGARLGAALAVLARGGRDKVTFTGSGAFDSFGLWAEQLLAESTGKEGNGLVPIADEPLADPADYGSDRVFVWLGLPDEQEAVSADLDRLASHHPVIRTTLPDLRAIGGEFFRWEFAVATAGAVLGINPFDQPNVEESKRNAREVLSTWKGEDAPADESPLASDDQLAVYWGGATALPVSNGSPVDAIQSIAGLAGDGDYVALLPYFAETSERDGVLSALRERLMSEHGVATTLGYGPRYLHSTGQLHKGGPGSGIYILLTTSPPEEVEIPGQEGGFGRLMLAQALGDFRTLATRGRRVARIHLGTDVDQALARLATES
jgi:transaldolase/glucose-6-phosphate isomerase